MRVVLICIIGSLIIGACNKKADLNLPYEGDRIVLNTFIQVDSPVYIRVTKSQPVAVLNDLNFPELPQAQVTLLEDGAPYGTVSWQQIFGKGYFVSNLPARPVKHYTVTAAMTGLTSVRGTDSIPLRPVVQDLFAQKGGNQVRFTLQDPPGVTNYYRIHLYDADTTGGELKAKSRIVYRLDPSFSNNFADIVSDAFYEDIVIKDERFAGQTVQFVLQTSNTINYHFMMAQVIGISESAYKYLQTAARQQSDADESNALTPPIRVYSNIENGYGIVAGMYAKWINCKVKD